MIQTNNAYAKTLKQINKAIGEKYPGVFLVKGKGYFYIASDEEEMGLRIAGLYQSGIYVYRLSSYKVEEWVREVGYMLGENNKPATSDTAN